MTELHLPWLELAIAAPLLGALWVSRAIDPETGQRRSLAICGVTLLLVFCAWIDLGYIHAAIAHDRWSLCQIFTGSDPFVIDEINAPLLPMAALLYFVTALATLRTKVRRFSFSMMLVSEAILLATLSCNVPWGIVTLLAIGVLPPLWEIRARRGSTRVFAVHMTLFVAMLVVGWWMVVHTPANETPSTFALALLVGAVLLRSGIVPLHCWMTDLFERASFGTALLFVTPMVGVYAAVRLLMPIAPDWALRSLAFISLFTAVYAAGMALVQRDARRFFCYLLLSHSSLVLVGLEMATPLGLTGALCLWISVGLSLTGFGLVLRSVEARVGSISLDQFHGLYEHTPTLAAFFLLTGLASIGFPGTIGFVGSELLFESAVDVYPFVGLTVALAAALNGVAILQAYFRVFTGRRFTALISLRSRLPERMAVLTLALLILGGGLFPQPGLSSRYHAAMELIKARRASMGVPQELEAHAGPVWFKDAAEAKPELELINPAQETDPAIEIDAQSEPQPAGATPLHSGPSAQHGASRFPNT